MNYLRIATVLVGSAWLWGSSLSILVLLGIALTSPGHTVLVSFNAYGEMLPELAMSIVGLPAAVYATWRLLWKGL